MRTFDLESFLDLEDALWWLEVKLRNYADMQDDVTAEINYINNQWRVGVITNTQQQEFDFGN